MEMLLLAIIVSNVVYLFGREGHGVANAEESSGHTRHVRAVCPMAMGVRERLHIWNIWKVSAAVLSSVTSIMSAMKSHCLWRISYLLRTQQLYSSEQDNELN